LSCLSKSGIKNPKSSKLAPSVFRIKNSPGVMLPVFAFFGSKNVFFDYLDISLALKQPNLQHAESHSNFWF
jgi:hypothetical protein